MLQVIKIVVLLALTTLSQISLASDSIAEETSNPTYLYVQTSLHGSFDGKLLTLEDMPGTYYFADRPSKKHGTASNKKFKTLFGKKESQSFGNVPPNAVLSILDSNKNIEVVLEGLESVTDSKIVYKVSIISGVIPSSFTNSSLFIDGGYPYCCAGDLGI